jgi:hypothetical protein
LKTVVEFLGSELHRKVLQYLYENSNGQARHVALGVNESVGVTRAALINMADEGVVVETPPPPLQRKGTVVWYSLPGATLRVME